MGGQTDAESNRLQRRKARTRAALVGAAQEFIAEGRINAPLAEITQAADVGTGSFYNHFRTRDELFQAAVEDVLDLLGATLDELTGDLDDPAHIFAQSFRLTGRLHRRSPIMSKVLLNNGITLANSDKGLAPRASRDLQAAAASGRFHIDDIELAMTVVVGAVIGLGQLLHKQPGRDDGAAADHIAEGLLRMFGLSAEEAHEICQHPLPVLAALPHEDSAA